MTATIREFLSTPTGAKLLVVGGALLSATGGGFVTYVATAKRLEKKYADLADQEIAQAHEMYKRRYKDGDFADLEKLAEPYEDDADISETEEVSAASLMEAVAEIAEKQQYTAYDKVSDSPVQTEEERIEVLASMRRNVFEDHGSIVETEEFDPEKEQAKKDAGKPYILENDVFYENEEDYDQYTLTYFEEDDVLVDEQERPIPRKEAVVGDGNLRFGYGTYQKDVVLIHNPTLKVSYEVTRDSSSYAKKVLNYDPEEDRRRNRIRKFRDDD